jgi:predicted MFS family arabinose efflux permease
LIFALTNGRGSGWASTATLAPLAGGVALLFAFLALQARARDPLMPFAVWLRPNFGAVMAISFCLYAAWNGVTYFLVLTLQRVLDYSPTAAAVAMLPLVVGGIVGSTVAGVLLPRAGPKPLLLLGLSVYVAAIGLMALLDDGSTYWFHIFVAIALANLGNSCTMVATNVTALSGVDPEERSLAGGLFTTSLQVGSGLGLALISVVAATAVPPGTTGPALLPAYQAAFRTALGIAVAGIVIAVLFVHTHPFSARPSGVTPDNRAQNGGSALRPGGGRWRPRPRSGRRV